MQLRNTFALYSCSSCGDGYDDPQGESLTQTLSPCCGEWTDKPSTTFGIAHDIPIMSFKAFQATRQPCASFRDHFKDEQFEDGDSGFVYLDGTLWILDRGEDPFWILIERSEFESENLAEVERALYNYAVNDGRIVEDLPPTVVTKPKASDPTRPLAKSLHTISALENLTRWLMTAQDFEPDHALRVALTALKLDTQPDPYGLAAAALKKIKGKA